ncbi:MAG TPA: 2-dehydropantoate 2-reductase [Mycobacterium sp.]|jgi:2-dehydropantoate 2-reductase|nr:2-dehydropantoate 2-reductase [Mycobacterium sp.]
MRVVVLGAGGLGSVLGGYLAEAGAEVTLVARLEHVNAVNDRGLRIVGRRGEIVVTERLTAVTSAEEVRGPVDYLILAVKAKDTEQALAGAGALRGAVRTALSVQNTVSKDQQLIDWLGKDRVLGASTIEGGTLIEPGLVHNHLSTPVTAYFGELNGRTSPRLLQITKAFSAAAMPARAVGHIAQVEWEKLAQIALVASWSVTSLGAVPSSSFFEAMTVPAGAEYFVALAKDLLAVYRGMGYTPQNFYGPVSRLKELDELAPQDAVEFVIKDGLTLRERGMTGRPSMYGDVLRGRKTEVESMLGAYVGAAHELDIEIPTLLTAYRIIKTLDHFLD